MTSQSQRHKNKTREKKRRKIDESSKSISMNGCFGECLWFAILTLRHNIDLSSKKITFVSIFLHFLFYSRSNHIPFRCCCLNYWKSCTLLHHCVLHLVSTTNVRKRVQFLMVFYFLFLFIPLELDSTDFIRFRIRFCIVIAFCNHALEIHVNV